ncbi:MAG: DUF5103 domain-containing protein [Bacteroidota bacterium]
MNVSKWLFSVGALSLGLFITSCSPKTTVSRYSDDPHADSLSLEIKKKEKNAAPADVDYYKEYRIRYEDYEYADNIKTVLLYRDGFELSAPIINFNSDEKLVLKFDDLNAGLLHYKYTIIHCDAYWRPSQLMPQEYINGFTEDDITTQKYSFNTLQRYTSYSLTFPTSNLTPSKSGNYVLVVYPEGEPDSVSLTRRFMIVDNKLSVNAKVNRARDIEYHNYKQEVDFTIDGSQFRITDPYKNLKVVLQQNNRWDNAVNNLQPAYVKGDLLDYNYLDACVFSGGNEFRWFDIKGLKWKPETTRKVEKDSAGYEVYINQDERATFKTYYSLKDINGRRLIKSEENVTDTDIESEYVHVHLFLNYEAPLSNGSIYVLGALTGWRFSNEGLMKYNYARHGYEANLYLKQGYYNYQYVFVENGKQQGDESLVEGMHYETENDYTIYAYYRAEGTLYDQLIAVKQFNTYSSEK